MEITFYLPEKVLTNEELAAIYPEWSADKIYKKTGIKQRRIARCDEFVSDMAVKAGEKLIDELNIEKSKIEFLIVATQSPDYKLPTTACIVQDRLGIPKTSGALDINLGCSAYIYGLSLAKALVMNGTVKNVLLITAETYSKYIHPMDKSVRTIFGDGAAATLIDIATAKNIGEFVFGTDGSGYDKLIVPAGGAKRPATIETNRELEDSSGNIRTLDNIYMNGADIFNFTIEVVPACLNTVLEKNNMRLDDIDLFVFHQANQFNIKTY